MQERSTKIIISLRRLASDLKFADDAVPAEGDASDKTKKVVKDLEPIFEDPKFEKAWEEVSDLDTNQQKQLILDAVEKAIQDVKYPVDIMLLASNFFKVSESNMSSLISKYISEIVDSFSKEPIESLVSLWMSATDKKPKKDLDIKDYEQYRPSLLDEISKNIDMPESLEELDQSSFWGMLFNSPDLLKHVDSRVLRSFESPILKLMQDALADLTEDQLTHLASVVQLDGIESIMRTRGKPTGFLKNLWESFKDLF